MLTHVISHKIPTTICTMYRPNFDNPQQKDMSEPGLAALNDVIISGALKVYQIILFNRLSLFYRACEALFRSGLVPKTWNQHGLTKDENQF